MKKLLLVSLCFLMLCVTQVFAQNRTITGTVTAKDDGLPIPGATVKVKGTNTGTQTNGAGKYTLSVPANATLVFSFVGDVSQQVQVGTQTTINVVLVSSSSSLNEVVVTGALGIKHPKSELGYAVAQITPKELTQVNSPNIANGLTAKVAGLAIYSLDNGVDPNVTVNLRGNRSLEGNNSALIVLDGVPIPSATLNSINPNDIADVTVLKGAGAAALYGSEASNGALLITTKRGTSGGKPVINYGNSFQFEKVSFYPKLQNQFGTGAGDAGYVDPITGQFLYVPFENEQYGPRFNGSIVDLGNGPLDSVGGVQQRIKYAAFPTSPVHQFFVTGYTEQNDISYQQGDNQNSIFISGQNVHRTTVVPNDLNERNAFSVRGKRTYGIFSVDYSIGYTKTKISTYGQNYVPQFGENSLYGAVLQLPANLNLAAFKDPAGEFGNPNNYYDDYAVNPYWIVNNARVNTDRDQILSNVNFRLEPTKWLSASYRISNNWGVAQRRATSEEVDFSPYAISDPLGDSNLPSLFAATGKAPGTLQDLIQYGDGTFNNSPGAGYNRIQGDAILDFHHTFFKDFKTDLLLGNTIWQQHMKYTSTGSNNLLLKDFYNINTIGGLVAANEFEQTIRQIAFFGDFNISYKGWLTLDATLRNEHDSRLSTAERSFSYPSGKISFVPTEALPFLKDNKILDFWKIYGSLSRVGNINIGPYEINNVNGLTGGFPFGSLGGLSASTTNYSPTLKPELTTEFEVGTDFGLFGDRLNIDIAYYNSHDKNQTVNIGTSITTGYNQSILNIGETQSQGYEFQVAGDILTKQNNKVLLRIAPNFSINQSKVISLLPGVSQLSLGSSQYAVVGQPFPLLKGTDFNRDPQGRVIVDANTGYPSQNPNLVTFGRTTPKYDAGINTTLSYKFITLTSLFEYRGGNVIFSSVGQSLLFTGSSYQSGEAGRERFVYPNSVIKTGSTYTPNTGVLTRDGNYTFWEGSAYSATTSPFVSSGAFWKLREVSLSFDLNQFINKSHFIKGATFALTGRNLFIWVPKSNPYTDPEFSDLNPFQNTRGVSDDNITPGTRIFGADLKLTF
ncbi:MAG: SusC/RagA family TonB-linked outer membrane protein [Sphingobacteriales bacterium]